QHAAICLVQHARAVELGRYPHSSFPIRKTVAGPRQGSFAAPPDRSLACHCRRPVRSGPLCPGPSCRLMRIALTGASGIVGGFALRAVRAAGHEVTVLDRSNGYLLGDAPDLSG